MSACQHCLRLGPMHRIVGFSSERQSHAEVHTSPLGITLLGHCLGFVMVGQLNIMVGRPASLVVGLLQPPVICAVCMQASRA